MVSVDGLLDTHEVSVRARVESLREQAVRVAVELGEAELALEHVAITRAALAAVIAGNGGAGIDARYTDVPGHGVPGSSLVPVWRALADARGPVRAKELAATLGLEVSAAKVEGLRCKLKRLAARGWITESAPGAFAVASTGPASPGGAS